MKLHWITTLASKEFTPVVHDITEKDPQLDNYADEDVSQNLTGQARIPTLATQNSCLIDHLLQLYLCI